MKRLTQIFVFLLLPLATLSATTADSAQNLLTAGRIDDAIAALRTAPSDAESANLLCRAYLAVGDLNRAESSCKQAVALDPNNGRYHRWLGHVYGEKADHANFLSAAGLAGKTRQELERGVELSPHDVEARADLAEFYFEAPGVVGGGHDKARAQAKILGTTSPFLEHWVYAHIAERNNAPDVAEREYRTMIEVSHGDAEAWLDLALFFRHQKRFDDMEAALIKASESPITKPDVLVDVAQNLYRTGRNPALAIQVLQRYLASGPVEQAPAFKAHYLLGTIYERQGDKSAAAREYRTSLSLARQFGLAQQALNRVTH
ncbi:MAG: tetratricopeptide repeat protein [Terriglobales bacterium]